MYNNDRSLGQDIDLASLDELAKSNNLAKQKQYDTMTNILRKSGNLFSFVTEAKIVTIASMLQERGVGSAGLERAMRHVCSNYDKFPSFKQIVELSRSMTPKRLNGEEEERKRALEKEDKELEKIEAKFIDILGEDKLDLYVK